LPSRRAIFFMTSPTSFSARHGLPSLGVGIGLRREFYDAVLQTGREVGWLEIVPENFMSFGGRPRAVLDACAERWTVLPHGVALDVGGPDPLSDAYLDGLASLAARVQAPFFSDHLCYAKLAGRYLHDLLPLPFSEAAVEHVVPRVRAVQARVGRPFLLENPSYYAVMPGGTLDEASFLRHVLEEADCGLLLDVNNVWVNAQNHGYDPRAFIDALPLSRVAQVHLAGHEVRPEVLVDTHGAPVCDEVWALYGYLLSKTGPVPTLIEWDHAIPSLDAVLDQADTARGMIGAAPGAGAR
jgi:uncharacterized protein (UPF0276 family)